MPNPDKAKSLSATVQSITQSVIGANTTVQGNVDAIVIGKVLQQHVNELVTQRIAHIEKAKVKTLIVQGGESLEKTLVETLCEKLIPKLNQLLISSISQQQTQQLISSIKEKYKQENTLPDMLGGPILTLNEGCYVNLALIKSDEQIANEQSLDDTHQTKDSLPLNQLFVTQSNEHADTTKPTQRVLMLGRAGIGKSTLCQYLAYRWASDDKTEEEAWLEEYNVLLWIKLRELLTHYQSYEKNHKHFGLVDAVTKSCVSNLYSSNNTTITDAINDLIHDSTKKVLWVLDGFDEVAHLYGLAQHPLYTVLHEIFPRAATPAPSYHVLLTSRPYAAQGLQVDRTIENIGLLDKDIPRYVTQYFSKLQKPDLGKKVTTQIKTNPNIYGMAYVPINAYLICHLYQAESNQQQEDTSLKHFTLTQLYQRLVVDLCKRMVYQPRHNQTLSAEQQEELLEDYPEEIIERYRASLWVLAHLAFRGLTDNKAGLTLDWSLQQQVLRSLRIKIVDYKKAILPLGLLKTIRESSEETIKAPRYFMHLTFQEFFAALYLVWSLAQVGKATQQDKDQALNFLKNDKYTPRYQVIFWFAAGLVRDATWFHNDNAIQQTAFTTLWHQGFLGVPQDITGFGQFDLLSHAFEEGGIPGTSSPSSQDNPINTAWTLLKNTIDKTLVGSVNDKNNKRLWESLFTTLAACPHLRHDHAQALTKYIQDDKWRVRKNALEALTKLNVTNPNILQHIAQRLTDCHKDVRRIALDALVQLNVTDPNTLQQIAKCLTDDHKDIRQCVLNTLAQLKVTDSKIHQHIVERLTDDHKDVRRIALDALVQLNVTDPNTHLQIAEYLTDDKQYVRLNATRALAQLKIIDPKILQQIDQRLTNTKCSVRLNALNTLAQLKITDPKLLQHISEHLADDRWSIRQSALKTLAKLKITNSNIHKKIAERLSDDHKSVRQCALSTLAKFKITDPNILQQIAQRLTHRDKGVRQRALEALAQLKITDPKLLQQVAERLTDDHKDVRQRALEALAYLNMNGPKFLQQIAQRLIDNHKDVRRSALNTLAKLKVTDLKLLQQIAERLIDKDKLVRRSALSALAQLKVTDPKLLQQITERLIDKDELVRRSALSALAQLKVTDPNIHQHIAERLTDKDGYVRQSSLNTLAQLKITHPNILQQIAACLTDDNKNVRQRALDTLAKLKITNPNILQQIAACLTNDHWQVRRSALNALAQLKVTVPNIHHQIAERLTDDYWQVRKSSVNALNRLQSHLTIECWLPVWDKLLPNDSKEALSATTIQRIMTIWIKEHLNTETNNPLASSSSLLKISRLFAIWIFDVLQVPLVIDENQCTLNMITAESADKVLITFPHHQLGQTAFKRCKQALTLQALIHPFAPFPEPTHILNPEHRLNALRLSLKDYFDTKEGFDFDYVLHNILHTYAALFEQKPQLWRSTLDLILKHPTNQLLTKHPILHHIYLTTPIQTLLKKRHKSIDHYLSTADKYYYEAKLDKAIYQYEKTVMLDPNDYRPYHNLACCYHVKTHTTPDEAPQYCKLAEYSFNLALERNPRPQFYAEYGQFLYLQKHYEKALELLTQAIVTTLHFTELNLGYNSLELLTLDDTLQAWVQNHKILKINSAHLAYYLKYRCYEALGQTQQQITWHNQWATWLASLPGKHLISQHLLNTCQIAQPPVTKNSIVLQDSCNDEMDSDKEIQQVIALSLAFEQPVAGLNNNSSQQQSLPAPTPTRPSHEITSNNEENTSQNANTAHTPP